MEAITDAPQHVLEEVASFYLVKTQTFIMKGENRTEGLQVCSHEFWLDLCMQACSPYNTVHSKSGEF